MSKKTVSFFFILLFLFLTAARLEAPISIEHELAKRDGFNHSEDAFNAILSEIKQYHPTSSKKAIGDKIIRAHTKIKKKNLQESVFTIAEEIRDRATDSSHTMTFKDLSRQYIREKENGTFKKKPRRKDTG